MITREDVGAVILLCTTWSGEDVARVCDATKGLCRVERVRGPYDFVIHAAGPAQVEVIERLAGVAKAEVCWFSPRSRGGTERQTEISEVKLPGVGVRNEFTTQEGKRVGLVSHRSGYKELYFADPGDRDAFKRVLGLSDKDARTLAELLGGTRVTEELAELQHQIEGLAIDWLPLRDDSPYVGHTIGDARIRSRTGVSVVADLGGDQAIPAPGPELGLQRGDYLVVVGTTRGIEGVVELLHRG